MAKGAYWPEYRYKAGVPSNEGQKTVDNLVEGEVSFFQSIIFVGVFFVLQVSKYAHRKM